MGKYSDMKEEVENSSTMMRLMIDHYMRTTGMSKTTLSQLLVKDQVLTARDCVRLGLCDAVM